VGKFRGKWELERSYKQNVESRKEYNTEISLPVEGMEQIQVLAGTI